MKNKRLWLFLLIVFAAVNVFAFAVGSFAGLATYLGNLGPWGILATVDLLIALMIGVGWMWKDARQREVSPVPYLLLTLATGSLGLLVYLARFGMVHSRS